MTRASWRSTRGGSRSRIAALSLGRCVKFMFRCGLIYHILGNLPGPLRPVLVRGRAYNRVSRGLWEDSCGLPARVHWRTKVAVAAPFQHRPVRKRRPNPESGQDDIRRSSVGRLSRYDGSSAVPMALLSPGCPASTKTACVFQYLG